jgi:hypothetical protein
VDKLVETDHEVNYTQPHTSCACILFNVDRVYGGSTGQNTGVNQNKKWKSKACSKGRIRQQK